MSAMLILKKLVRLDDHGMYINRVWVGSFGGIGLILSLSSPHERVILDKIIAIPKKNFFPTGEKKLLFFICFFYFSKLKSG